MSPRNLPDGPFVSFESRVCSLVLRLLGQVIPDTADLQEALAVTRSYLSSIIVKLAVVYIVLVQRVDSKSLS